MTKTLNPKIKKTLSILTKILAVFLGFCLIFIGYLFLPLSQVKPTQDLGETLNYQVALDHFNRLQAQDGAGIRSECKTTLLDHGQKTAKSIVLFHGFTSCPKQYDEFSQLLFEQGYNVLIPRLPFHGLEDLSTRDQNKIQAVDILNLATESVKIASGLGDEVDVLGLSGGGVMALWAGLNLKQVSKSVVISPIVQPYLAKIYPQNPTVRLLQTIPDQYIFWDNKLKEKAEFAPYAYKGFSTKALSQFLAVAQTIIQQVEANQTTNTKFTLITSDIDQAVDNNIAKTVFQKLEKQGKITQTHVFTATENIPHDAIDPRNKAGNIKYVYPKLMQWIQE
jgi:carboxylesterase